MADDTRGNETPGPERTVSTPEGDNEYTPDQPLEPSVVEADVDGLQQWPTNSGMEADKKQPKREQQAGSRPGLRYVIDEISTGKILP